MHIYWIEVVEQAGKLRPNICDRFYTHRNVSDVYEFTEADDSFSEAYDSLSREPITITSRSTLEWFWLVFIKKIRLIYLIRSLLIGPEKEDSQSESLSKR